MGPTPEIGAAPQEGDLLFVAMADAAPIMIWLSGLDKLCTFFNKQWLDFTGRSMEQERGNGWAEGVHPEDLDRCVATYNSAFDARRPFQMEYRLRCAKGEYRWVLDKGTPLYREREFAGFVGSAIDVTEQRRTTEQFRANEARLLAAQRLTNVGSWERRLDVRGSSIWSEEMFQILGITPDHSPSFELFLGCIHPEDRRVVMGAASRISSGTEPGEYRIIRPGGQVRFVRTVSEVMRNQEGEPVRIVGATQDITERKEAEEALRRSEARWNATLENFEVAIVIATYDEQVIYRNPAARVMHGFTRDQPGTGPLEEMVNIFQLWALDGRLLSFDEWPMRRIKRGETLNRVELRLHRPDQGWEKIISYSGALVESAIGERLMFVSAQDLTDQRKAEWALRESEERFRRVFDEGPLGLALEGKDYRFVKVNSAYCQMVGYDEKTLSHMSFVDITHPEDVSADLDLHERLLKGEIPVYRMQKRYVKKSGEVIWINLTKSVIHGPDGETQGLAMIEDITETKRSQEEAIFRQKLESVGTLAGGIAHDFNNLLGAIQAQAELAITESDAGSSCMEELSAIRDVAMRGSEIVRQLMIYAGQENTVAELVNLSLVVEEMLSLLKLSVTKHAVINATLDHDLPAVRASAAQVRQIVMNLITNASDAIGDRHGIIRVMTRRVTLTREPAATSSRMLPDGDYVQLAVSDMGRGMSAETQARVFDPFFTTNSAGRGLGLAVVQGIVRSLGGAITITSEPNKGSTFLISLPCAKAGAEMGGHVNSVVTTLTLPQHGTVLVVEDEDYLRQAVVKMLRNTGFDVFEAADGSAAIDALRVDGHKIDVILLDMTMPGPSTGEIIAQAANARPEIKVVLTSAYSQGRIAGAMKNPQVHSFIRKPFRFGDLLKTLRSCLSS